MTSFLIPVIGIVTRDWSVCCWNVIGYNVGLQLSEDDECYEFKREQRVIHRTHPYYLEYDNSSVSANDVTLVTQLSVDRLHILKLLCKHWDGPISLALYMFDAEAPQLLRYVMQTAVLRSRRNIAYHIVYKDGVSLYCFLTLLVSDKQVFYKLSLDECQMK